MASFLCENDAQCPGNSACFANVTWYDPTRIDPAFAGAPLGCICSPYYGNTGGPDCFGTDSFVANWWLGSCIVLAVLAFGMGSFGLHILHRMHAHGISVFSTLGLALFQLTVSMFAMVLFTLLFGTAPRTATIIQNNQKYSTNAAPGYVFLAICIVCVSIGGATVSLTWVEVARKSKRLISSSKSGGVISPFVEKMIIAYEIIFSVVIAVTLALALFDYLPFILLPFEFVMLAMYIVGAVMFTRLLNEMERISGNFASPKADPSAATDTSQDGRSRSIYGPLAREIRETAFLCIFGIVFAVVLSVVLSGVQASYGSWREAVASDHPTVILLWSIQFLGVLLEAVALFRHLKRTVDRRVARALRSNDALMSRDREAVVSTSHDGSRRDLIMTRVKSLPLSS